MKLRHALALTTCTAAGALTLAACGGNGDDDAIVDRSPTTEAPPSQRDPLERLRVAESRTKDQRAADIDVEMTVALDDQHVNLSMTGTGDMTNGAADLTMAFSGDGVDGRVHLLTDSETVWFSRDQQTWYSMPASEFSEGSEAPTNLNASSYLAFLEGVGGEVTEAGVDQIDGQPATHYEADIDAAAMAQATSTDLDAGTLADAGISSLPFDVWIGEDDLVRRVAVELDAEIQGSQLNMDIQADFSNFRDDYQVTTPPAGQILPGTAGSFGELVTG